MPKTLFYAGVVVALFLALLSFRGAILLVVAPGLTAEGAGAIAGVLARRAALTGALVVLSMPLAALFVRMAAIIVARNVFAAFFTLFFSACTAASLALVGAAEWRFSYLASHLGGLAGASSNAFADFRAIAFALSGFFLVLTLLSSRAYFRLQASRWLSTLLYIPALLYVPLLAENRNFDALHDFFGVSAVSFLFLGLIGTIFFGVGIHCLRHRHLFLEVTNLRELLDSRVVDAEGRQRFGFGHDVAYDS